MSQTPFSERAKFIVDRTKALFTLDPRWHEEPVYEGDPDPRVGELLDRLNSAEPVARTQDGEMAVRRDPDTLRGWLVTTEDEPHEAVSTDTESTAVDHGQSDNGDGHQSTEGHEPKEDGAPGRAAGEKPAASTKGPRQKMTPLHSAQVRALKNKPELLEHYQQTGSWDEPTDNSEQPTEDEA